MMKHHGMHLCVLASCAFALLCAVPAHADRSSAGESFLTEQDFVDKYDVLDLSLQTEIQDGVSGEVLAAAVLQRGKSEGSDRRLSFDAMVTTADELADRLACRIDNAHVPAGQRIDCTDPAARDARPSVIGQ